MMHTGFEADFSKTVEAIYDAAADPSGWEAALMGTADLVSAGCCVLFGQSPRHKQVFWAQHARSDPLCSQIYAEQYFDNPWSLVMRNRPVGEVVFSDEVHATDTLLRTGFWHDVLRPQDVNRNAMARLAQHDGFEVALNICRTFRQGPYGERERRILEALMPHLQRAYQLQSRLEGYQALRAAEFSVLEHLAGGVVVLDRSGVVLFANRAARRMHEAGGPILLRDGAVKALRPAQSAALLSLIRSALLGGAGGALELRGQTLDDPCLALVAPLRGGVVDALDEKGMRAGGAVVFLVARPQGSQAAGTLSRLYGLTPAESRVAVQLGQGEPAPAVAATLGVSVNTVKTHMRRIFDKTGVNRQAEFAGLMARLQSFDLNGGRDNSDE